MSTAKPIKKDEAISLAGCAINFLRQQKLEKMKYDFGYKQQENFLTDFLYTHLFSQRNSDEPCPLY